MRFGAGVKVKCIEALQYGVPVVSTSVGAEGLGLHDSRAVIVTDDPRSLPRPCSGSTRSPTHGAASAAYSPRHRAVARTTRSGPGGRFSHLSLESIEMHYGISAREGESAVIPLRGRAFPEIDGARRSRTTSIALTRWRSCRFLRDQPFSMSAAARASWPSARGPRLQGLGCRARPAAGELGEELLRRGPRGRRRGRQPFGGVRRHGVRRGAVSRRPRAPARPAGGTCRRGGGAGPWRQRPAVGSERHPRRASSGTPERKVPLSRQRVARPRTPPLLRRGQEWTH